MPGGFCVAVVLFSVIWIGWDFISQTINVPHSRNPLNIQVQVVSHRTLTSFEVTPSLTKSSSNIKWLYQFPHEFRVNFGGLCYVMSQFYVAYERRDRKLCRKQHVKIDKSRSLTSPRSPRNTRVHPCLLLSTLTLIIYSCPHWHWEKHPLTVSHMYTCAILFSRNRGMYAFHIISSTLHSRTST